MDILKRTNDEPAMAVLLSDLGFVARETGQHEEALRYYERSLALMKRVGNEGGLADVWRMMAHTYVLRQQYDEAEACCRTSEAVAERMCDELRVGGARYVLAHCFEAMGRLREAAELLEQVVAMDRTYNLPKLQENVQRLHALRVRLREGAHT